MGLSLITAINIATNSPDNIKVASGCNEAGQWAGYLYLMRDGEIHTLLLSTQNVFETDKEAETHMQVIHLKCVEWYKEDN